MAEVRSLRDVLLYHFSPLLFSPRGDLLLGNQNTNKICFGCYFKNKPLNKCLNLTLLLQSKYQTLHKSSHYFRIKSNWYLRQYSAFPNTQLLFLQNHLPNLPKYKESFFSFQNRNNRRLLLQNERHELIGKVIQDTFL